MDQELASYVSETYEGAVIRRSPNGDYIFANSKKFQIDSPTFVNNFSHPKFKSYLDKTKIFFTVSDEIMIKMFTNIKLPKTENPKKICVDYSSPNIAKELHVGHMRSTNIGQVIVNVFEALGHEVHGVNHIGDFGTQFGKLIALLYKKNPNFMKDPPNINNLQEFYVESKKMFETNEEFKTESYRKTKLLQNGDTETVEAWKLIVDISRESFKKVYSVMNILIPEKGESFYQNMLQEVVDDLEKAGLISTKEDPNTKDKIGNKNRKCVECDNGSVVVVQKSDGSFLYGTTDLAALKYRLVKENYDEIYYVVDKGQEHHFSCVFEIAKKMGWLTKDKKVVHVKFGVMTNNDGSRIKSRDGNTISLQSLFDDAVEHTEKVMKTENPNVTKEVIEKTAIGAIKYCDLSIDRVKNYKYDPERMLSLKGDTVLYQFYSHARVCQILNLVESLNVERPKHINLEIKNDVEKDLIKFCLGFDQVFEKFNLDQSSYHITKFLYGLNTVFAKFYKDCRIVENKTKEEIINGETKIVHTKELEKVNWHRVYIIEKIGDIQKICFNLLHIECVSKV